MPTGDNNTPSQPGDAPEGLDNERIHTPRNGEGVSVPLGALVDRPPSFGESGRRVPTFRVPLDNARPNGEQFDFSGTFLMVVSASSPSANADVRLHEQSNSEISMSTSNASGSIRGIRGVPFGQIYISNKAQPGEFLEFMYVMEDSPKFEIIKPVEEVQKVQTVNDNSLHTTGDVTVANNSQAQIFDVSALASSSVANVMVTNIPGTGPVRIGDSNTSATRGDYVAGGATWSREIEDDVYAYNPNGSSVDLTISWTEK